MTFKPNRTPTLSGYEPETNDRSNQAELPLTADIPPDLMEAEPDSTPLPCGETSPVKETGGTTCTDRGTVAANSGDETEEVDTAFSASDTDREPGSDGAFPNVVYPSDRTGATDSGRTAGGKAVTTDATVASTATETATGDASAQDPPAEDKIRRVPRFALVMFVLAGVCAVLYLVQRLSPAFSDFFNTHISSLFRRLLAWATCWFPFSLAEVLLILLPVAVVLIIVFVIRKKCETWRDVGRFCLTLLSVVALLFNLFVLNFSAGYYGTTLDEKLGITCSPETPEELYRTAVILAEEVNRACAELDYDGSASSEMPYSVGEMNRLLMEAYNKVHEKYGFIDNFYSRVKPVMLSEPMSYTHITGVYTYFTGEANINVNFPDYCTPFTAAHELAHQRGVARENEANFVAFLVCIESDDAYIRYSGYLNLYEYVMSALSGASGKLYKEAYLKANPAVRGELHAYAEFFEKYRDNVAADISGAVNDSYLHSQGTVGQRSYGLVVDLAVAYYREST